MEKVAFKDIPTYEEFEKYYWYKEELSAICKQQGIDNVGNKIELMARIKQYFEGTSIPKSKRISVKKQDVELTLETKILQSGFAMRNEYRDFFAQQTGIKNFKYTANMAAAIKKVRQDKDKEFTVKDLIDVYYGKSKYAQFDNSSCQWNQFVKDFCKDERNSIFTNKLKVATILWKIVRESTKEKVYAYSIVEENLKFVSEYVKK